MRAYRHVLSGVLVYRQDLCADSPIEPIYRSSMVGFGALNVQIRAHICLTSKQEFPNFTSRRTSRATISS